jgi:prepilin peptidase CpaA
MILFIIVFCLLVATGFAIASGIADFKALNIPNIYSLGIILAFIPAFATDALSGEGMEFFASWKSHLIAGLAMFAITFVLFSLRMIGAGDSKLATALALWMGLHGLPAFLFYMSITGALLGIGTKIMNGRVLVPNAPEGSWIGRAQSGKGGVPYGIALALGAINAYYQLWYFSPEKLAKLACVPN